MMNEEYKVKQLWPNHADHISLYKREWLDSMFLNDDVIAQRKYDGERSLVHFNDTETYITSRRSSKKTGRIMENQDKIVNLPTLQGFGYTVIDTECYSKDWSSIVGILHSLPERAYDLQKTTEVKFAIFDCLYFNGRDIRDMPYGIRMIFARQVLKMIVEQNEGEQRFHIAETTFVDDYDTMMNLANSYFYGGFEGIVVKSLNKAYYDKGASLKVKRFETVDCVVIDYQQGTGKYSNTVGALILGYYDADKDDFVRISKVNCGTDEDRNWWRDNWSKAQYTVLEVKCQEITDTSLRHPVYIRKRDDKDYHDCTRDTIFK